MKMKKYRYGKIKPEDVEVMKELRSHGLSYKEIGKRFDVSWRTPYYHLNPREKEMGRKRANKTLNKLTKKQKKKRQLKQQKYRSEYMKDRYSNDEKFRKDFIEMIKRNFKKRRKNWEKKDYAQNVAKKERIKDGDTVKIVGEKIENMILKKVM